MDPLSITASIVAVLQAANFIISVCYEYKALVTGLPSVLTQTITEIRDLRRVLEDLDNIADGEQQTSSATETKQSLAIICRPSDGPVATCLQELQLLQGIIRLKVPDESISKRRPFLQAVQWQFKEKDVKRSLERIERCKSTLALAITANQFTLVRAIHNMNHSLMASVSAVDTKIEDFIHTTQIKELNKKQSAMSRWLSPVDPSESHDTALTAHQQGTNTWFTDGEDFRRWLASSHSALWLSGFPGGGKTILFASTVEYLRNSRPDLCMAYYYVDFRRSEAQDVVNIFGSLVAQLCSRSGLFPHELQEAFDQSKSGPGQNLRPSLPLLTTTLKNLARDHYVFLMLDGLDECHQKKEACTVLTSVQESCKNIRILTTSRDDGDISGLLYPFTRVALEKHLLEVNKDINSYIMQRLSTDHELRWLSDSVKEDIATSLIEKSKGM